MIVLASSGVSCQRYGLLCLCDYCFTIVNDPCTCDQEFMIPKMGGSVAQSYINGGVRGISTTPVVFNDFRCVQSDVCRDRVPLEDYGLQVQMMSMKVHIHNSQKLSMSFQAISHLADVCFGIMSAACLLLTRQCGYIFAVTLLDRLQRVSILIFYHLHAHTRSDTQHCFVNPFSNPSASHLSYTHSNAIRLPTIHRLAGLLDLLQHRLIGQTVFGHDICGLSVQGNVV